MNSHQIKKLLYLMIPVSFIALLASFSGTALSETAYTDYASFPASSAHALIGPSGHGYQGDVIGSIMVVPATTSAGSINIFDGSASTASMPIYTSGTLSDLKPFFIPINARSHVGGWYITTGASETVYVNGRFQ